MKSNGLCERVAAFDRAGMLWVRNRRFRKLTSFLQLFTYSGTGKAWAFTAILLNLLQLQRITVIPAQTEFLRAMLCAWGAWGAGSVIKRVVNRRRPSEKIEGYVALVSQPGCRSFPSSHASASVALAVALALIHHEWAGGVAVWAGLVTFSRFYLGVHYPTDLLGGISLGVLCGWGIVPLTQWMG